MKITKTTPVANPGFESITAELTYEDVLCLRDILGRICGRPSTTRRGVCDGMYWQFDQILADEHRSYMVPDLKGELEFTEPKK